MTIRRKRTSVGVAVLVAAVAVGAFLAAGASARQSALPRSQTLYTSGTAWGPFTQFNPLRSSGNATGTIGLLYETLFRYDPLKDRYIPWLATSGKWVGTTFVVTLRKGVTWNDGKPFTGADVKFTFETGKLEGSELSTMWKTGLQSIGVKGNAVSFRFKGQPNYLDWATNIFTYGIVPAHVWKNYDGKEIATGNTDKYFVGTGPFSYGAGKGTSGTLQWNRRDNWWATKLLGIKMPMKYIVDIHNTQNTASLQNFLQNNIDLSNNFFPGIDKQIGGKVQTYYTKPPYMLSANTAWLIPNTTKAPLNDAAFRRALAMSINVDQIVKADYGNIVAKANPDRPPADLEQVDRPGPGEEARVQVQHRGGEGAARGERLQGHERRRLRREEERPADQPPADRAQRVVRLDDGDPDHRGVHQGRRDQDHARLSGLQRARRPAQHGQVRPGHQQRQAARPDAVHLLRLPLPPPGGGHADLRELLPVHGLGAEAVGADARAQQGQAGQRREAEADPVEDPEVHPRGVACDSALVQRAVVPVQHDVLDELPEVGRRGAPDDPERLERLPQHDGHRRARAPEAAKQG